MPTVLELETLVTKYTADIREAETRIQQLERLFKHSAEVADRSAKSIDSDIMKMGKGAIALAGSLIGVGSAMEGAFRGVKLAAEAEQTEASFTVLIGSVEEAQKTLGDLREFALSTPFEMPELLDSAKSMMAFGEEAENLIPTMRLLGEVSSGLGVPLKELSYLYGTLKAQGRAFTVDIRQFASRGIPIYLELAKALGLVDQNAKRLDKATYAKLDKMIESGKVDFEVVEKAFKNMTGPGGRFFGQLEAQSKTVIGLFNQMKEEIDTALKMIGTSLIQGLDLKGVMRQVSELSQMVNQFLQNLSPETRRAILVAGGLVGVFIALSAAIAIAGVVFNVFFGKLTLLAVVLTTLIGLTGAWAHSVGGLAVAWKKVKRAAEEFWNFIKPALPALAAGLALVAPVIAVTVVPLAAAVLLLVEYWDRVKEGVQEFWTETRPVLRDTWELLKVVGTALRDTLVQGWEMVAGAAVMAAGAIAMAWSEIGIGDVDWRGIRDGIRDFVMFMEFSFGRIREIGAFTWYAIRYGAIVLVDELVKNIFGVMAAVLFPPIWLGIFVGWEKLWEKAKEVFKAFVNFVKTLIIGLAVGSVKAMADATVAIKDAITNFEVPDVEKIKAAITGPFEKALEDAGKVIGKIELGDMGFKVEGLQKARDAAEETYIQLREGLKKGFQDFKRQRGLKFQLEDAFEIMEPAIDVMLALQFGQGERVAEEAGMKVGGAYTDGIAKAIHKFDAALFGSAEAMSRLEEYRSTFPMELNREVKPTVIIHGAPPPPNSAQEMMVGLLRTLVEATITIRDKPPVQLIPAAID